MSSIRRLRRDNLCWWGPGKVEKMCSKTVEGSGNVTLFQAISRFRDFQGFARFENHAAAAGPGRLAARSHNTGISWDIYVYLGIHVWPQSCAIVLGWRVILSQVLAGRTSVSDFSKGCRHVKKIDCTRLSREWLHCFAHFLHAQYAWRSDCNVGWSCKHRQRMLQYNFCYFSSFVLRFADSWRLRFP